MKPPTIALLVVSLVALTSCASPPGIYTLEARDATTHGEKLRYEPEPHKNTLGYWVNPDDWAQWSLDIRDAGRYEVHILQGCGAGQGGSTVRATMGDEALSFKVVDTGHFQNFRWRKIGVVQVPAPGVYSLEFHPVEIAGRAVMDLRRVKLVRVEGA